VVHIAKLFLLGHIKLGWLIVSASNLFSARHGESTSETLFPSEYCFLMGCDTL